VEEAQEDHQCIPHPGRPSALPWTSAVWGQHHQYRHGRWPLRHGNVWRRSLGRGRKPHDSWWVIVSRQSLKENAPN